MRLAPRHRLNPKKEKIKKRDPTVRKRKRIKNDTDVVYLRRDTYEPPVNEKSESSSDLLDRLNSQHNMNLENDVDLIHDEILKRGWKISTLDVPVGGAFVIRFSRNVGGVKSRAVVKKSSSVKKLFLLALEHVLDSEGNRYESRMSKMNRKR